MTRSFALCDLPTNYIISSSCLELALLWCLDLIVLCSLVASHKVGASALTCGPGLSVEKFAERWHLDLCVLCPWSPVASCEIFVGALLWIFLLS